MFSASAREVIESETDADWLPKPNRVSWIIADKIPKGANVTAAYVIAKLDDKYLTGRHRHRGWDLTGGHLDPGETPEAAAIREAREETGAIVGKLKFFAYQKIELLGVKPEGYRYPHPTSYQALFLGEVLRAGVFAEEEDMVERAFLNCEDFLRMLSWPQKHRKLFERINAQ